MHAHKRLDLTVVAMMAVEADILFYPVTNLYKFSYLSGCRSSAPTVVSREFSMLTFLRSVWIVEQQHCLG